jgi:hypothetical protein
MRSQTRIGLWLIIARIWLAKAFIKIGTGVARVIYNPPPQKGKRSK